MLSPWDIAERTKSEFAEQSALFAWAAVGTIYGFEIAFDRAYYQDPQNYIANKLRGVPLGRAAWNPVTELKWLHAIKNQGHGDKVRGARSAAEGVKAGVFDVFLPVFRLSAGDAHPFESERPDSATFRKYRNFSGLYIELKKLDRANHKDGGASDKQLEFQRHARGEGFAAEIAHGWLTAAKIIERYIMLEYPNHGERNA